MTPTLQPPRFSQDHRSRRSQRSARRCWRANAAAQAAELQARSRREAARAALEALRAGRRRRSGWRTRKKFTEVTGVEVRVDSENWEDIRPKAAVAANVGTGPDIILSTNDDSHQYPDKLLDVSDLCEYLGKKYGPWYPSALAYGKNGGPLDRACRWARRQLHELSREPSEGGRLQGISEGHRRAFSSSARRSRRTARRPVSRSATRPAMPTAGATGCSGLSAARWSTRTTRSRSTPRRPPPRWSTPRQLYPTFMSGHAVVARSEQQQGIPVRRDQPHHQRHLDLLRGEELDRSRRCKAIAADIHHANFPDRAGGRIDRVRAVLHLR